MRLRKEACCASVVSLDLRRLLSWLLCWLADEADRIVILGRLLLYERGLLYPGVGIYAALAPAMKLTVLPYRPDDLPL